MAAIVGMANAFASFSGWSSPVLRCQIQMFGIEQVLEFASTADPYRVKPIDIQERFRFKAVVKGDGHQVEYVKIYIYYLTERQPVPLDIATYPAPKAQRDVPPMALTGKHQLYSPDLGRELQYGCALLDVNP